METVVELKMTRIELIRKLENIPEQPFLDDETRLGLINKLNSFETDEQLFEFLTMDSAKGMTWKDAVYQGIIIGMLIAEHYPM
ncbi:hypothetical protein OH966_003944 [Vibrio parahaemolyticus]|uniref:hypothetical protein n=1 Tax=Vibrio harveyi group TaxID=717610 RepID=UPI00042641B6|nr:MULTISPECIES: hypothetical protein [Vibrio harveyi group]EGQ8503642.1 hypothetical protein [Vibrio parahaemolyticus]EGQ9816334.1 hypothetical protein [Vibrio parahaemolyticus]EGR1985986.1 hypothetical protein [Vibrio parahaemolyticus]EHH2453392.1 hypothetical protein [Vibrio parahaemolyticus]EHQ9268567.1 hypothetical protein [Vibrio parahaemolyticus]